MIGTSSLKFSQVLKTSRLLALVTSAVGQRGKNLTAYRRTAGDEDALVAVAAVQLPTSSVPSGSSV